MVFVNFNWIFFAITNSDGFDAQNWISGTWIQPKMGLR